MNFMNSKIVISISILITIVIAVFSLTQNQLTEKQTSSELEVTNEISSLLDKIKQEKNENLEGSYSVKEREWISTGPVKIDRSEYALGEKIFVNLDNVNSEFKGQMIFGKVVNMTHTKQYKIIYCDGLKSQSNCYFGVYPDKSLGFCTAEDILGDWRVIIPQTNLNNLNFKIVNDIVPGLEDKFEPVC